MTARHTLIRPAIALVALFLTLASADAELKESLSVESPALNGPMKYSLFLPEAQSARLPVLYLLHGLGGHERDWQALGHIAQTATRLIRQNAIPPMAIVMPDGANSWYVNSEKHGLYEDALLEDLIPETERTHGFGGDRSRRAIAGLSMGGYGAFRLAFRYPDRFAMTAGLSAAIFPDLEAAEDVSRQQIGFFKGVFGEPFDVAEFNRQNFFSDIPSLMAIDERPAIWITVGDDDGFGLYEGNIALYQALKQADIPVEFRMTDGNHTWRLWRAEIENVLRYYGRVLATGTE
ncbi:alpha/beta hydrolase family protein [uncultured Nisaea sp.]|uniref:alpha/beta hydrolase n=1 Tax=uncultured Nisaea sp. TaxID=538215 RepID=UPI0030EE87FD|tara:strand:- start:1896 stop:2768 length:873 start_codon:yes stop_codon:yes gene_type:complete